MTTKINLSDLYMIELEQHDVEIIANAINIFGSGQHPVADANSLDCFDLDYMLDCLDKGIAKATNEEFKEEVQDIWVAVHQAKEQIESEREANRGMSHDEFEETMKRIHRKCTLVHRAETDTFYNVSPVSAKLLRQIEKDLDEAADSMGDES